MKICIPIAERSEGGMYTFIGNFRAYLDAHGNPHTSDPDDDYDVLFVNSWAVPYGLVRRIKESRPDLRVVQRVDGASRDYGGYRQGDARQARVNLLADLTIFQSEYSRFSTTRKYHVIRGDGPVIYNPVDLELFSPDGPRLLSPSGRIRVACATWSVNPRKGAGQLDAISAAHPDVDFVLCGRFEGIGLRPNAIRLGHLGRHELASALRSCDVFLNVSENDPAPNVVIEALASGLPVLFRNSGGVPELVGDCGLAFEVDRFGERLDEVLHQRERLSQAARARAVSAFTPGVIFPRYLAAILEARRRSLPSRWAVVRLAVQGYPVLSGSAEPALTPLTRAPHAPIARRSSGTYRIGWVTYDSFPKRKRDFAELDPFTGMRAGNIVRWMGSNVEHMQNELYDPQADYDVVVFQKMMDSRCQRAVRRLQAAGTKVIFDANVNYYEIWGDYFVPGTRPTARQQRDAIWMTRQADWVVADSNYLSSVIRKITPRVTWIPDNVDPAVYGGVRQHGPKDTLALIWSGISQKAAHLLLIRDVLRSLKNVTLVLLCESDAVDPRWLPETLEHRILRFSDRAYAAALLDADVIISPKYLVNGYEMAHSEYKISLGMSVGLPAVASPQPSYVDAISHLGGGIIARTPEEWAHAFTNLAQDWHLRAALGERARRTVQERYSTPVVARQFCELLKALVQERAVA